MTVIARMDPRLRGDDRGEGMTEGNKEKKNKTKQNKTEEWNRRTEQRRKTKKTEFKSRIKE